MGQRGEVVDNSVLLARLDFRRQDGEVVFTDEFFDFLPGGKFDDVLAQGLLEATDDDTAADKETAAEIKDTRDKIKLAIGSTGGNFATIRHLNQNRREYAQLVRMNIANPEVPQEVADAIQTGLDVAQRLLQAAVFGAFGTFILSPGVETDRYIIPDPARIRTE